MKRIAFILLALGSLTVGRALAVDHQPRGSVLELHSCELYAGGCVVSSESTLGGRYLLRAWNFSGGKLNGADLAGLQIAVFETGAENLAAEKTTAGKAVIYLPSGATQSQTD